MTGYRQRAYELAQRLEKRAAIRRQIPGRKSAPEGEPDRLADLLDEAAKLLRSEIIIGPRTADLIMSVLQGEQPTEAAIAAVREEIGDLDDVVPF